MSDQTEPANSLIAEQSVLGSILVAPRCIATVQLIVQPDDFWRPAHQVIYETLIEMSEQMNGITDAPKLVTHLQSHGQLAKVGGAGYIHTLMTTPATASNVDYFATRVRELSRVRRWRQMVERCMQSVAEVESGYWSDTAAGRPADIDLDRFNYQMARFLVEGELLADEKMNDLDISGLMRMSEFLSHPDVAEDWVVEDLIELKDVWMILATEGGGKSWLSRQMVMLIGAGIHPFDWDRHIRPRRTLLIDLENAESMVRRQSRGPGHNATATGNAEQFNENTWIWTRPEGLNLRDRRDQLLFQTVLDRVRPEFVAMGSLYNSFQKGRDDWETAAEEVKTFLNRMRTRYNCALWLEHHMPKGDGNDRPLTPYGSSVWMRWVTNGRVMQKVAENTWTFKASFRGDRDVRKTPAGLQRGGRFPWAPVWDEADIEAMVELEDELGNVRRRARRG